MHIAEIENKHLLLHFYFLLLFLDIVKKYQLVKNENKKVVTDDNVDSLLYHTVVEQPKLLLITF